MARGLAAGVAPMPERSEFRPVPAPFTLGEFTFGPGPEFTFQGSRHPWAEAFIGGGLSKEPGPVGCFHHANRRTTWIIHEGGRWFAATAKASPLPTIAKAPEPEAPAIPEELTIVYRWVGNEFEAGDITGYPGGFFSVGGREYQTGKDTDFTCPTTGVRVYVKGDVVRVTSGNIGETFKYAKPNLLQRLLASPTGWYWITTAAGKETRLNSLASCAFWHPATPITIMVLLALIVMLKSFPLLVLWVLGLPLPLFITIFHPARRHLPWRFFQDGAEDFFEARRIYKAVKAEPLTHFSYLSSTSDRQS